MPRFHLFSQLKAIGSAAAIAASLLSDTASAKTSARIQPMIQNAAAMLQSDRKNSQPAPLILQPATLGAYQFAGHRSHSSHRSHRSHVSSSAAPSIYSGSSISRQIAVPEIQRSVPATVSVPRPKQDPKPVEKPVAKVSSPPATLRPSVQKIRVLRPSKPRYSRIAAVPNTVLSSEQLLRVRLNDTPGDVRPGVDELKLIISELKLTVPTHIEFVWTRGRYVNKTWARAYFKGTSEQENTVQILQDVIDFDIIKMHAGSNKTTAEIALHPVSDAFPSKTEISDIFNELGIHGNCHVEFFFEGDQVRKYKAAQVMAVRGNSPAVSLFPSSARH